MRLGSRITECRRGHGADAYRRDPRTGIPRCRVCIRLVRLAAHPPKPKPPTDPIERFWTHVDRSGGPLACWNWMGGRRLGGYGQFSMRSPAGKPLSVGAHRFALALSLGRDIAEGMGACHSCDNPPCCNPTHLFEGSTLDNIRDAAAKGRMALGKRNVRARYKFRGMARKELTPALVQLIRLSLAEGYEGSRIAAFLGINAATVSRIKNGTRHVEVAA